MLRRCLRRFDQHNVKWFDRPVRCHEKGMDLLQEPLFNKALAFSLSERDRLGIRGLLPPAVREMDGQLSRSMDHIRNQPSDIFKNIYLQGLHSRNETLFHRVLLDNIEELAPLVYTPTVGLVCQQFGNQFRRPRGMFFSTQDRGHFSTMAYNWPHDDVHVIVVTDGSRILGLGDLGAQGMGIPIGKLALYCAAGGIAPHRVLPVTLDVGTNNEKLLADPNYIGMRHRRLEGEEYYDMVDEFMSAVFGRWPEVCVQFEDFETPKAVPLLAKYRNQFRCFNDDIQGTGAVTVGALMSAAQIADVEIRSLRVLCAGGGSAGLGICESIKYAMLREGATEEETNKQIVINTHLGTVGKDDAKNANPHHTQKGGLDPMLKEWVNPDISDGTSLLDAIKQHRPHVLLGVTACGGLFTDEILTEMGKHAERPIILPLSNPTSKAECSAEDAYRCTEGRAIVATGSPFPPCEVNGRTYIPSQCNNMYIFPGLGLAASVGGVTRFTDKMFYLASKACTAALEPEEIAEGRTFPRINKIRDVSHAVATAVLEEAHAGLLTSKVKKHHVREGLSNLVSRKMYYPDYVPIRSGAPSPTK